MGGRYYIWRHRISAFVSSIRQGNLFALALLAGFAAVAVSSSAQAQQDSSLADAARQARAQKSAQAVTDPSAAQPGAQQSKAQQTANELSEDQNHAQNNLGQNSQGNAQTAQEASPSAAQAATESKPATPASGAAPDPTPATSQNLAQAAPATNQPPATTVPAGFKIHAFIYCKSRNECWNASVLVPTDAQLVSSACKQYAFETKVQGTTFVLLAGPAVGECNGNNAGGPDLVRWNQLADPENKRTPGTYSTIGSQNTTVDGKPAAITTISFRKGLDTWMGKRVELESNGVPLVVGCMAPRDHFVDGDAICSQLIGSLLLP